MKARKSNAVGRGTPSREDGIAPGAAVRSRVDIHTPLVIERQYRTYPFLESWSNTEGFKSFTQRRRPGGGYTWTWKAQLPDGRHVYLHGLGETMNDCLLSVDYCLEREDWRLDKYS